MQFERSHPIIDSHQDNQVTGKFLDEYIHSQIQPSPCDSKEHSGKDATEAVTTLPLLELINNSDVKGAPGCNAGDKPEASQPSSRCGPQPPSTEWGPNENLPTVKGNPPRYQAEQPADQLPSIKRELPSLGKPDPADHLPMIRSPQNQERGVRELLPPQRNDQDKPQAEVFGLNPNFIPDRFTSDATKKSPVRILY